MGFYRKAKLAIHTFRTLTTNNPPFPPFSRTNLGFSQLGPKLTHISQFSLSNPVSRSNLPFSQLGLKHTQYPQVFKTNLGFSQSGIKKNQYPQFSRTNLGLSQLGIKKNQFPQFSRSNFGFSQLGIKKYQFPQFSRTYTGFSQLGIKKNQNLQKFGVGARRYYYVDRYQVHHFRPRGPKRWFQNPRTVLTVVLIGSGLAITIYLGNLETVPYTKRKHFVLLSKQLERQVGETQFKQIKGSFKGKILPAIHPESVRVRLIAKDIIEALQRGLKHEQAWSDLGYGVEGGWGEESEAVIVALSESTEGKWHKEDEVLDDRWVQESRKTGSKPNTSHMEGLNWEVIVVNEPVVNAFCLPGGKIVVFTGLLDHFRSDSEVATIVGHEVGHAVARHAAEGITKNLWFAILQLVLYQFVMPDIVNTMSTLFLRLPFSRRMEMEADYIGLLLIASAGYDPRVAPTVYEKLGKITGESALRDYLSTHPSGKKRAQLLAQAQVMEEAMGIYREVLSGKGVEGFL